MRATTRLPDDEVRSLEALSSPQMHSRLAFLHANGWSLASLGRSLTPPRPKTTIHYWVRNALSPGEQRRPAPRAPITSLMVVVPTSKAPRVRFVAPKVPPDLRPRLRELAQMSRKYRARTPDGSPTANATRELTRMALELHDQGIPTSDIAAAAGISYRAMSRRVNLGSVARESSERGLKDAS